MKKSTKLLSLILSASLASQMISSVNINATKDSVTFYDVKNNILDLKAYDAELDTNHDGNMNVFDVIRANKTLIQEESYTDLKEKVYMLETQIESLYQKLNEKSDKEEGKLLSSNDYTDEEKQKLESLNNYDDSNIKSELSGSLSGKVDKEEGKQLSSNDYTDEEKKKLEGLNNYDDADIKNEISEIKSDLSQSENAIIVGSRIVKVSELPIYKDNVYINIAGSEISDPNYCVKKYELSTIISKVYGTQTVSIELNGVLVLNDGTKKQLNTYSESNPIIVDNTCNTGYLLINVSKDQTPKGIDVLHVDMSDSISKIRNDISSLNEAVYEFKITKTEEELIINYNHTTIVNKPYNFNGKNVLFFGDSITQNVYSEEDGTVKYNSNVVYSKLFADKTGISNFSNQAIGGSSFANGYGSVTSIHDVILSKSSIGNFDYSFIFGGTNDYDYGVPIGNITDTTPTTFYGALNDIAAYLNIKTTADKIIFILPINRTKPSDNKVAELDDYREAIYNVCCINGYSVLDGTDFGFPSKECTVRNKLIGDGLHPTLKGHEMLAKALYTRLL